jgi:HlyD family secretion protein
MSKKMDIEVRKPGTEIGLATPKPVHFEFENFNGQTDFETVDHTVNGLRKLTIVGATICALFFGSLGTWFYFAELASAAMAPGVVSVASNHKTIQHLEGGIVKRILVSEGDVVATGQKLIELDATQTQAKLESLKTQKLAALALDSRLSAERDGLKKIVLPPELDSMRGDKKVRNLIRIQEDIFKARRRSLSTKRDIIVQRIEQSRNEIQGLRAQVEAQNAQLKLVGRELDGVRKLYEKKLIPVVRLLKLEREVAQIKGQRGRNKAMIARVKQKMAEARLQNLELNETVTKEVVQELRGTNDVLNELNESIPALADELRRLNIVAPIDGTVTGLQIHTVGGVISAGKPIMGIVPKNDSLVIEAKVNPVDIDVVHPGLDAEVRLTAIKRKSSVPFDARVLWVSADRFADPKGEEGYFLARLEITGDVSKALNGVKLYPGMQAEVTILTGKNTFLDFLTIPIKRNLARAFRG